VIYGRIIFLSYERKSPHTTSYIWHESVAPIFFFSQDKDFEELRIVQSTGVRLCVEWKCCNPVVQAHVSYPK